MTPKQDKLVDEFFADEHCPTAPEPFAIGPLTFMAFKAMRDELRELRKHTGVGPGRRYQFLGPMKDEGATL